MRLLQNITYDYLPFKMENVVIWNKIKLNWNTHRLQLIDNIIVYIAFKIWIVSLFHF